MIDGVDRQQQDPADVTTGTPPVDRDEARPRRRTWRDFSELEPPAADPSTSPRLRRIVVAGSFGVAALAIVAISLATNWPEDESTLPEVGGALEVGDDGSGDQDPEDAEVGDETETSSTTSGVPPNAADGSAVASTTTIASTTSSAVITDAAAEVDLAAAAAALGQLEVSTFNEVAPAPGELLEVAVRLDNRSVVEIPVDRLTVELVVDDVIVETLEFDADDGTIAPDGSAVAPVRVVLPPEAGTVRVDTLLGVFVIDSTNIE